MATRVDQLEAQAAATVELSQDLSGEAMEQRFKALESSADVEQELRALKARVQKELPGSSETWRLTTLGKGLLALGVVAVQAADTIAAAQRAFNQATGQERENRHRLSILR
jgi:hypothetical protein